MNMTMKQLVYDITELRKKAGLTQQELADLSGEPCRTFIAHLEQGRRDTINLEKLYSTLHILLGKNMSTEFDAFCAEMENKFNAFKAEVAEQISELKVVHNPNEPQRLRRTEKRPKFIKDAVNEIMTAHTGKKLHAGEVIDKLLETGDNLVHGNGIPYVPKRNTKNPKLWDLGVVGTHLFKSCVIPSQASPAKATDKRFIKMGSGIYTANTHYRFQQGVLPLQSVK